MKNEADGGSDLLSLRPPKIGINKAIGVSLSAHVKHTFLNNLYG